MANSNLSAQKKTAVREKLFGKQGGGVSEQYMVTSVDWAEKNFADAYHKVFVEGIKKEEPVIELAYEQELAEEPERKYKVRVFDPKSEKSYVRFATREKISRLRAKGLKVEMTSTVKHTRARGRKVNRLPRPWVVVRRMLMKMLLIQTSLIENAKSKIVQKTKNNKHQLMLVVVQSLIG